MPDNDCGTVHQQREGKPYALVAHVRFEKGRMETNSFAYYIAIRERKYSKLVRLNHKIAHKMTKYSKLIIAIRKLGGKI